MGPEALLALACAAAFGAGFVDSVAGGGGLIQLPAVLLLMPGAPVTTVLATNKGAAVWGTLAALLRYLRSVPLPGPAVGGAALAAFAGSFAGARVAALIPNDFMRPLVMGLLAGVAWLTWTRDFGVTRRAPAGGAVLAAGVGAVIGFYDGFFGPGTGTFLIVLFVWSLGLDFLGASAAAKAVNVATNVAALLALRHEIVWAWSLPMAAANVAGALLGSRLAIRRGAGVVRRVMQGVVLILLVKLAWDHWAKG